MAPPTLLALRPALSGGEGRNPFEVLFGHVLPHPIQRDDILGSAFLGHHGDGEPLRLFGLTVWNIQAYQILAVLLLFLAFRGVAGAVRSGGGGGFQRVMAGWAGWLREEVVFQYMDRHHGQRLLPLFLFLFFFIFVQNALGLVPFGATATASAYTNAGLATVTFLCMILGGMLVQGPLTFWRNLIPHGLPAWLVPLMFVVELIGLCVKPFALTVRLFANMTGGHLVLLSFMGLIFYFGTNMGTGAGLGITPVGVGMSVFIMIIEGFVALLQAYIFTLLSVIFVGMCLHPDH